MAILSIPVTPPTVMATLTLNNTGYVPLSNLINTPSTTSVESGVLIKNISDSDQVVNIKVVTDPVRNLQVITLIQYESITLTCNDLSELHIQSSGMSRSTQITIMAA
jgi:hypothetical protein